MRFWIQPTYRGGAQSNGIQYNEQKDSLLSSFIMKMHQLQVMPDLFALDWDDPESHDRARRRQEQADFKKRSLEND